MIIIIKMMILQYCENRVDKRNWTRVNDRSAFWDNMKIWDINQVLGILAYRAQRVTDSSCSYCWPWWQCRGSSQVLYGTHAHYPWPMAWGYQPPLTGRGGIESNRQWRTTQEKSCLRIMMHHNIESSCRPDGAAKYWCLGVFGWSRQMLFIVLLNTWILSPENNVFGGDFHPSHKNLVWDSLY